MANPELIDGFDKNDTNTQPVPDFLKNDGYADGQAVEAYEHNELFKQLFAAANKNKKDGIWDYDATLEYGIGSKVSYNGEAYTSLAVQTGVTPVDDDITWRKDTKPQLWQNQAVTITPPTDADYTLDTDENGYGRLVLDLSNWTQARNIIVDNSERSFIVDNSAGTYTATVKTSAGTGIPVLAGTKVWLLCDGTDVINSVDTEVAWVANDTRAKTALNASGDAPIYACRAWVNFNGTGTVAIRASGNVSSITDRGVGMYTVNFAKAMPDANYSCGHLAKGGTTSNDVWLVIENSLNLSTTSIPIKLRDAGRPMDFEVITLNVFR